MRAFFYKIKRILLKARSVGLGGYLIKLFCIAFDIPNFSKHLYFYYRILKNPYSHIKRILISRKFMVHNAPVISKTEGYVFPDPDAYPGIQNVVEICQRLYREKLENINSLQRSADRKEFFYNILTEQDIIENPELMEFALSDKVLNSLMSYYGYVPKLCSLGLFVSPPNTSTKRSQMWHYDGTDLHHVKCFINVFDVGEDDGPFSFIPADRSLELEKVTSRRWKVPDITEENELKDVIQLVSPPGGLAFTDTSRCLHYGSRVRGDRPRVVFQFHYAVHADYTNLTADPSRDLRIIHYPKLRQIFSKDSLREEVLR